MNFLTYVRNYNLTFKESPFNRVDALVLCWLAYFNFPQIDYSKNGVALGELPKVGLLPDRKMYAAAYWFGKSKKLFKFLISSRRFKNVALCNFTEDRDEIEEKQFAAVCLKLEEGKYFVAFRGTDPSFLGWKESLNLAWRFPLSSQEQALNYLEENMKEHCGAFCVGGHSKGGNFAVYAAINAQKQFQDRIVSVFNFDGPEFIEDIYSGKRYENIADKIYKIVPNSSFVGMLFDRRRKFEIIRSKNLSLLQHDPFSWAVEDNHFILAERRTHFSVRLERALNNCLSDMSVCDRKRLIELIYGALKTLKTDDFNVFFRTIYIQVPKLYIRYRRLKKDDRRFFNQTLKSLKCRLIKYKSDNGGSGTADKIT